MRKTWNTKWGVRRVRVELPTLGEALDAACGLSSREGEQIEIAAGLMNVAAAEIHDEAKRILQKRARLPTAILHNQSGHRTLVIVRKSPRARIGRPSYS